MMAKRGSNQQRSQDHECFVASVYAGKRSASSGAAVHDAGDVRTELSLIECKTTGGPEVAHRLSTPRIITLMEKAAKEAWEEGREPVLAMRYYLPMSLLADSDGFVDIAIRPLIDDAARENELGR